MRVLVTATTLVTCSLLSASAFARVGIEADLESGRRWGELTNDGETDGLRVNEAVLAARYSIGATGLSVGPAMSYWKFDTENTEGVHEMRNFEYGLEARYAPALASPILPYAKLRYVGYSIGTMEIEDPEMSAELNFRTEGVHILIGASYALSAAFSLNLEAGQGIEMLRVTGGEIKEISRNGKSLTITDENKNIAGGDRQDFNSKSLLLGLSLSL